MRIAVAGYSNRMATLDHGTPFDKKGQERARQEAVREKKAAEERIKREQETRKKEKIIALQREMEKVKSLIRQNDRELADLERKLRLIEQEGRGEAAHQGVEETEERKAVANLADTTKEIETLQKEIAELDADERKLQQALEEGSHEDASHSGKNPKILEIQRDIESLKVEEAALRQKLREAERKEEEDRRQLARFRKETVQERPDAAKSTLRRKLNEDEQKEEKARHRLAALESIIAKARQMIGSKKREAGARNQKTSTRTRNRLELERKQAEVKKQSDELRRKIEGLERELAQIH